MCINDVSDIKKKFSIGIKQKKEIINDVKYKNFINSRKKKMQEEIKDIIIDKYRDKIVSQQKEIEQLKKKLEETIKSSLLVLKKSINPKNSINNNISIPSKIQKQQLKSDILNINNKNDIIVHILNRNKKNKNLNYSTISSDNVKLRKNITQLSNDLTSEHKKNKLHDKNILSLSNSRIKINKYDIITPKRVEIETLNKPKSNPKSKNKKEKEKELTRHTINNIDIDDLNTYYFKRI